MRIMDVLWKKTHLMNFEANCTINLTFIYTVMRSAENRFKNDND